MYDIVTTIEGLFYIFLHVKKFFDRVFLAAYHQDAEIGKVVAFTSDNIAINSSDCTSISAPVSTATYVNTGCTKLTVV